MSGPPVIDPEMLVRIPTALIRAPHVKNIGPGGVWLYGYLCARIQHHGGEEATELPLHDLYQHGDAAARYGVVEATIRRSFRRLVDGGYIAVTQHRHGLGIRLTTEDEWGKPVPKPEPRPISFWAEFNRLKPYVLFRAPRLENGYECGLCHLEVDPGQVSIDHIIPRKRGGPNTVENLRVVHRACNSRKGAR